MMKRVGLVFLAIALLAGVFFVWNSVDPVRRDARELAAFTAAERDRLALERDRLALEQQEAFAASPAGMVTTALRHILPYVLGGIVVWVLLDQYRQRRVPLTRLDRNVVPRSAVERGELVDVVKLGMLEALRTQQLQVIHQPQATPHTYSPHITVHAPKSEPAASTPLLTASDAPVLPAGALDLASVLHGWQPSAQSILLAFGAGDARYAVPIKSLVHVALAGATGNGKTNIMRLLLAQLLAIGADVVLADPHFAPIDVESGDDWRPIERRLHMQPAVSADAIRHLLEWLATDELPRRLERRRNGQHVGAPLFLALDELPNIVQDVHDAPDHVGRILREGRKVNIFAIGAATDFLVKSVGGVGAVRDCYRTAYYTGGDAQTARVLLDVQGRVDDGQLGQGLALLRSRATPTAELVRVPYASNTAVYRLLGGMQQADTLADVATEPHMQGDARMPATSQMEASADVATSALQSTKQRTPEEERIVTLFLAGNDVAAIVKEVYGVPSSAGRTYQERSAAVQAVLRSVLNTAA
jgi:hypothetical protein